MFTQCLQILHACVISYMYLALLPFGTIHSLCLILNPFVMSGSSHIRSVLIGVEYQNWSQTFNVYLHFAMNMVRASSIKTDFHICKICTGQFSIYKSVIQFWFNLPKSRIAKSKKISKVRRHFLIIDANQNTSNMRWTRHKTNILTWKEEKTDEKVSELRSRKYRMMNVKLVKNVFRILPFNLHPDRNLRNHTLEKFQVLKTQEFSG